MKLSFLAAGALLAVGCGQFSEVTVQIQTLDVNKIAAAGFVVAGVNDIRNATIQDVRIKFLDATLKGQKADVVLFAEQDLELNDEIVDAELDVDVIEADIFDALEVVVDEIEVTATVDTDDDGVDDSDIVMLFEGADVDLTFNFQGFDSTKQNANIVIDVDLKSVFLGIDFEGLVVANEILIDGDVNTDELDFVEDFLNEPANITGNYFLSEQEERVKP